MLADSVIEGSSTTGTGTYTLSGSVYSGKTFAEAFPSGGTVCYFAQTLSKSKWEMGYGTLTIGPPRTLTRTVVKSSNADSAIDWQATDVFYVFSIASADVVNGLLSGNLAAERPWWVRVGGRWWDDVAGLAVSWIDKLAIGVSTDLRIGIYDAVKALYFPDARRPSTAVGAANKTVAAADINGCFTYNTTAANRTVTFPAGSTLKDGFTTEHVGLDTAFSLILTPDAGDAIDDGVAGATKTIPGKYPVTIRWDAASSKWRTNVAAQVLGLPPQGRLTLTSATPVLVATVSAATTIYYTPYNGSQVPIYDGSSAFVNTTFAELSNATAQSSTGKAGPAAVANNSNYDLFVWNDSGTVRLTRGPLWTSDTARGTGAGTTELQRISGIWTNKVAITNGPGANLGTYVGTVRSNGSATIDWIQGAVASNGTAAVLGVWNAYNRVEVRGLVGDTTGSWTYSTNTPHAANGSNGMRASFVYGLQEEYFSAEHHAVVSATSVSANGYAGVGYNSTSAFSGYVQAGGPVTGGITQALNGGHAVQPLGFGYLQAMESGNGTATVTWYGQSGYIQNGLSYLGRF